MNEPRYVPVYPATPVVYINCVRCGKRCATDKALADRLTPWTYVCNTCFNLEESNNAAELPQ